MLSKLLLGYCALEDFGFGLDWIGDVRNFFSIVGGFACA
jgi:hypothetical protein